jgi:hypothetical protein
VVTGVEVEALRTEIASKEEIGKTQLEEVERR